GNIWTRFERAIVRRRSGGGAPGQRYDLWTCWRRVHERHGQGIAGAPKIARGDHVVEHLSSHVQRSAVGRLQAIGHGTRTGYIWPGRVYGNQTDQHQSEPATAALVLENLGIDSDLWMQFESEG